MIARRQVFGLGAGALLVAQTSRAEACSLLATSPARERRRPARRLLAARTFLRSIANKDAASMHSVVNQAQLVLNERTLEPVYNEADLQRRADIVFDALSFDEVKSISTVGQAVFAELEDHYAVEEPAECGETGERLAYLKMLFDNSDHIFSAIFV